MKARCDVAVIGAGPAGAWAARRLARQGADVLVFDASHPREKPCGGGLTGRALALVGEAVDWADVPAVDITHARFRAPDTGRSISVPLDAHGCAPAGALVVTSRRDFDGALLAAAQQAGATLVPARVVDVEVRPDLVRIDTVLGSYEAGFVVGADGVNSLVRRRVTRPFERTELSVATGYFVHDVASREIVLELETDPPGYLWSFPRPSHLAVGICAPAGAGVTAPALRRRAARWIASAGLGEGSRLEPYSWPIPTLGPEALRGAVVAGPRWCLTGDAAGLVDPITREGIYFALLSGQWAADALGGQRATDAYTERVRDDLGGELGDAARLRDAFFDPGFAPLLTQALAESAAIRRVMADLIAGRQSYAGLKWRLARTLEVGLAWRALRARVSARSTRRGL